jgi:hypothetical protein
VGSIPDEVIISIELILLAALWAGPGVKSASNKNQYQKSSGGLARPARKADNFAAIREPKV